VHTLIHSADDTIQGVVELNFLHSIVERDLEFANEYSHLTAHATLSALILLYLLEVPFPIVVVQQVPRPLGVVGQDAELVKVEVNLLHLLAMLHDLELLHDEVHDEVL
tara:strand:- start:3043 stop:3366 length:324 start_codon:yes stop_codon:yes gene_type:complete